MLEFYFRRIFDSNVPFYFVEAVDEISTAESLQYAFSTIKAATNDFSDHNKLGQGGFGTVYKVGKFTMHQNNSECVTNY